MSGDLLTFLGVILTIVGLILAWYIYHNERHNAKIKALAEQVIAYYSEENVAVKKLADLTGENPVTIQKKLRTEAVSDVNNKEGVRPSMTAGHLIISST